jgi:3-(methylthio)propanoyl-CoA dehydrogenase
VIPGASPDDDGGDRACISKKTRLLMTLPYLAPVDEQLRALATTRALHLPGDDSHDTGSDEGLIRAILEQSAALAADVFAPLNAIGDTHGAILEDGVVKTTPGFQRAFRAYSEGQWGAMGVAPAQGGLGLPFAVGLAVQEQLASANMALSLCMLLSQGAVVAISAHGTAAQQDQWLPGLISGRWTGTMNLTEAHAGSDVGALRTRATPHHDGTHRIKGQKIFISWGEHELAENIVHLVLARLPDAPRGSRGISLFIVPKYLSDENGELGERNDVQCVAIERKLGIHGSPTCTMAFGDNDRCVGYLLGEPHRGLHAMFTMMNHARVGIGLQGVALAERALQAAETYAAARIQSPRLGSRGDPIAIAEHPDVRRMLEGMRATTRALRLLAYWNAAAIDASHGRRETQDRGSAQGLADLLTPITKGFASDMGVEATSLALQIFGGAGYIEETGVAQLYRDARIAPIYEGTNGIQALDLVNRKLAQDGGIHWRRMFAEMTAHLLDSPTDATVATLNAALMPPLRSLERSTAWLFQRTGSAEAAAAATPYLRAFGTVLAAYLLALQAKTGSRRDQRLAAFYLAAELPGATATLESLPNRSQTLLFAEDVSIEA